MEEKENPESKQPESQSNEEEHLLKTKYEYAPQHKTIYISGVFGGITQRGKIHASFWVEGVPIPKYAYNSIHGEDVARLGEERIDLREYEDDLPPDVVNSIEMSAILDPTVARSIGQWLIDRADFVIRQRLEDIKEPMQQAQGDTDDGNSNTTSDQ